MTLRSSPLGAGPAATLAAMPAVSGATAINGLSAPRVAISKASRSAGMMWMMGLAACRPVATIKLPAAL